jgi:hypothetical protein
MLALFRRGRISEADLDQQLDDANAEADALREQIAAARAQLPDRARSRDSRRPGTASSRSSARRAR